MPMTFEILERSILGWQARTFPTANPQNIVAHLVSEVVELARSIGMEPDAVRAEVERSIAKAVKDKPQKELGDVFHLSIGLAKALGSSTVDVTLPVHQNNLGRVWGEADPTTGIVEHVEEMPSRHGDILADSFDRLMKCAVEIDDEDDEDPTLNERPTTPKPGILLQSTAKTVHAALGLDPWPASLIVPEADFFSFGHQRVMIELKATEDAMAVAVGVMRRREDGTMESLALFINHGVHQLTVNEMREAMRVDSWLKVSA